MRESPGPARSRFAPLMASAYTAPEESANTGATCRDGLASSVRSCLRGYACRVTRRCRRRTGIRRGRRRVERPRLRRCHGMTRRPNPKTRSVGRVAVLQPCTGVGSGPMQPPHCIHVGAVACLDIAFPVDAETRDRGRIRPRRTTNDERGRYAVAEALRNAVGGSGSTYGLGAYGEQGARGLRLEEGRAVCALHKDSLTRPPQAVNARTGGRRSGPLWKLRPCTHLDRAESRAGAWVSMGRHPCSACSPIRPTRCGSPSCRWM